MNEYIIQLRDKKASSNDKIGSKASNLVKLVSMDIEVPDAFFVTSKMQYDFFLRNKILKLIQSESKKLCSQEFSVSLVAAKRIRDAVMQGSFSNDELNLIDNAVVQLVGDQNNRNLAVRSSGSMEDGVTNSWAGQFDSFLDVNPHDVPNYIKQCWASLFGARAVRYGVNVLENEDIRPFAVIVQLMITGECSGIAFSANPLNGKTEHVLVEAVKGSGEKAVGGQETPYSVILDKKEKLVLQRKFGSQGKVELLSPNLLKNLVVEIIKIEEIFSIPVDVEWTIRDSKIYILQVRPITSFAVASPLKKGCSLPDIMNYELTFKVMGLNVLFADLLSHGFGYLHPLFICNKNEFWQYFTKERMEYAAKYGYKWLSSPTGFIDYQQKFEIFHGKSIVRLENILKNELASKSVQDFFSILYEYFVFYSKMDFQFTNLTFLYADENPIISENLNKLSAFKDIARNWINNISINDECLFNKLLFQISHKFDVTCDDLQLYKIHEIIELFDKKMVIPAEIKLRSKGAVIINDGLTIRYIFGQQATMFIHNVEKIRSIQEHAKIVGQVANRGEDRYVIGTACLINVDYTCLQEMEKAIAQMKDGQILVSEFTAPELMLACSKARAIVTDMGGMLSHAAIISREFKIPCVVGTEHASRSLVNGDQIRIDLDLGIIEKL
ncbi:PEP/pyruvate-binding domain-containing protein [Akkermansia glycaniphila]|uniref:Phosphoenolpyruvate synthase n=1 Tax=Akkermansia glycaniphila TaxID=1679444 RepID=A0A1C7PFE1_9BACT|nr:PEP/pyruvate-binding domain-containing protein [Akkermansia glycaniphila]OCA02732.1 hypothetical protein AC781_08830 [Akkermansia glycaniphila]SEH97638.1 atp-grasp fold subdomain 1 [Akkermansia glycaniphila]